MKMNAGWSFILFCLACLLATASFAAEPFPVSERMAPAETGRSVFRLLPDGRIGLSDEAKGDSLLRKEPDSMPAAKSNGAGSRETESEARRESVSPPKRSSVENFFFQPGPEIGGAVGGPGKIPGKKPEAEESEADVPFYLLLSAGESLSSYQKINLFRQMDRDRQKKYLELLPLEQRLEFLQMLGEEHRWYLQDLKVESIDRDLKQFGYDFFQTNVGDFSPERLAPVGPDYVVGPGDTLIVSLWGTIEGTYEVTVDRSGNILLPRVGAIQIWGQPFAAARETIRRQIARYFTNFELNVTMGSLRSVQVYLVGEVKKPGTYTVSSMATVLNALAVAGGPAKTGSLRKVQLVRSGEVIGSIDFYDFFLNGDRSRDARLQSGDTIHVPVVGPLVGVAGDVRRPAIYELKDGDSLNDVLEMAGGVAATAYLKRVQVERVEAHSRKVALDLDLSAGLGSEATRGFALRDHDMIKVSSIGPVSSSHVRLNGYVARPGTYQLAEATRLADLILPYDNLLPFYFPDMAEILRLQPPMYLPEKLTVNLGKALAGDPEHNILLQNYDEIRIFSREEMEEIPEVMITGGVLKPGAYRFYANMKVRDLILAAGNVKRGAYLPEAELSRHVADGKATRTERVLFDLQKALAGDPAENLALQPEDRLFVRSVPDFAERLTVKVEGRVLFPGSYTISKGETLSSVIERAGGFAEGAYLRGATFTRESVKTIQRERLEKLIFEQEQQIGRASAEIAQGALSTEELQSAQVILSGRKAVLEKLKDVPITGRMVVHLAPLEEFRNSEYDIPLMDGDAINIPDNPKAVTVLGQVYNPISLAYQQGKPVSYYLAKVGGPTENANDDEMFIVRADGTVYSRAQAGMGVKWDGDSRRWVFGGFHVTELFPGDTLLVPEKVKRLDIMREVKDLTTILYQMALGAAAVASF